MHEAYQPVLEALELLCRAPQGARLVALLRQHAPTWLVQLPWLLTEADRARSQHELHGATRERMLRECAELVDALTAETPLLLVLEDLHWSDYATLDLLAALARRHTPARLLIVGTYRPGEALAQDHPLQAVTQDLPAARGRDRGPAGAAERRGRSGVSGGAPPQAPSALAAELHWRTDGHPLFLVTLVQALVERAGSTRPVGAGPTRKTL